jgi:multidrug resistance efflux pump
VFSKAGFTTYVLPLAAVAFLLSEIFSVIHARRTTPPTVPFVEPPSRPRGLRAIAGAGLVEARRENIPIGAPLAGVVVEVFVKRGDPAKKGDRLFRLDDRDLKAQLGIQMANLAAAEAQLQRLIVAPQVGDIPTLEAAVEEARAHLNDAEVAYRRSKTLFERRVEAAGDRDKNRYTYLANKATLARQEADLRRLKATWEKDKQVACATVAQAQSQVEAIVVEIERLTVRALVDGAVLQVHVRPGQLAALNWNEPLMVLGDIQRLHVRVNIDEQDLPYFSTRSRAVATLKGRPQVRFPLTYFDVEPYVIPKQSLTGATVERVDTRVLQVLYEFPETPPIPLYIGQQMDVYIEAAKPPAPLVLDVDPRTITRPFEDDPPTPNLNAHKNGK